MIETTPIVYCADCDELWGAHSAEAPCVDAAHAHLAYDMHRHRSAVQLPDGTVVTAVSFDPNDPYTRDRPPDFGLYLDPRWQPPWPHAHVAWPDFGTPEGADELRAALATLLGRARRGERGEIGCLGGHGRTGTALACLAIMAGAPAAQATAWVRAEHCEAAIETPEQEQFVARFENAT